MPYALQVLDKEKKESILLTTSVHPFILLPGVLWLAAGMYANFQVLLRIPPDHVLIPILVEFFDIYVHTLPIALGIVYLILFIGFTKIIRAITYALTTELVVTSRRVIGRRGFIRRQIVDIRHTRLESFETDDQSILGRIFRYGTIGIHGTGSTSFSLHTINKPLAFRDAAMRIIEEREDQVNSSSHSSSPVKQNDSKSTSNPQKVFRKAPAFPIASKEGDLREHHMTIGSTRDGMGGAS